MIDSPHPWFPVIRTLETVQPSRAMITCATWAVSAKSAIVMLLTLTPTVVGRLRMAPGT